MQRLSAPMNKMDLLAQAPQVASARPQVSWRQALTHGARLAVNIGPSLDGSMPPENVRRLVGALLFQALRDEIERTCVGWQERGRTVNLYIDELTDVAGSDADGRTGGGSRSLEWFRERGRSYGVRLVYGTQNPGQMDEQLLASFFGFMTVCCLTLRSTGTAGPVAVEMNVGVDAIRSLAVHDMMVRTVDPDRQPLDPFVVSVPHFDAGDGLG